jgi:hypothetical protein
MKLIKLFKKFYNKLKLSKYNFSNINNNLDLDNVLKLVTLYIQYEIFKNDFKIINIKYIKYNCKNIYNCKKNIY